jgi:FkbM family methyltransferase
VPLRPGKTLYYVRSLAALAGIAEPRSLARFLATGRRGGSLALRDGLSLRLGGLLDLLILKETVADDSYRLRELDGTGPEAIVDVGAGIGDFALWAAWRFREATVFAFEPNPASFALLEENIRANGVTNVVAHPLAVGLQDAYVLRNSNAGPRGSALESTTAAAISVPAARLDTVVQFERVDLLKIDCEGLELDVLESARGLLPHVRRVAIEYHRHLVRESDRLCLELLAAHGFVTSIVEDPYDKAIGYIYGRSIWAGA